MDLSARVIGVVAAIIALCSATLLILGPTQPIPELSFENVILAVILIALIVAADFFDIDAPISSVRITVSVSAAICFASAITLGPLVGAAIAGVSALIVELTQRRETIKLLVNVTNYVFATFVGGFVYHALAEPTLSPLGSLNNLGVTVIAASVYSLIDSGVIALVLAQVLEISPFQLWRANLRGVMFEHLTLPTLGSLIPVLKDQSLIALIIVIIPLLGPYLAFRSYRQVHDETRQTLAVLADMLDRRDPYTADHSHRVSQLVERMLRELDDVSLEESEAILTAARIHDLGKVTTSDATLLKPGKLTSSERLEIERHSLDGFEILSNISIFHDAAQLVRHHHERWDGKGYPDRLSGDAIPLGARLIAVADTYDAMTSDRVYRPALTHAVAVEEIQRHAGTQFDPTVVEAFTKVATDFVSESHATAPPLSQPPANARRTANQSTAHS